MPDDDGMHSCLLNLLGLPRQWQRLGLHRVSMSTCAVHTTEVVLCCRCCYGFLQPGCSAVCCRRCRSEYGGAAGSHAPSSADSGMLPALSVGRAELATLSASVGPLAGGSVLPRARRPSLPPSLPAAPRQGAAVVTGSTVTAVRSSATSQEALEATARRLSLPPVYYGSASQLRQDAWALMDQS